jgi:hypothetical protein
LSLSVISAKVGFNAVLILFAADAELIEVLEDLGLQHFDVSHDDDGVLLFLDRRLHPFVAHDAILRLSR